MASINDFQIPDLDPGILHPKHSNRFRVTFINIAGGAADGRQLAVQTTKCGRPNMSFDEIELYRYNARAFVAGRYSWETISMTIEDDVTSVASKVLNAQNELQQKLIGASAGQYLATAPDGNTYKFATKLDILDGGANVLETWHIEGCWIKTLNYGEVDYSQQAQALTIDVTLRFDHAYQTFGTPTGTSAALGGKGL